MEMKKQERLSNLIKQHHQKIAQSSRAKESPLPYLESKLELLNTYWKDFYENHWKIVDDPTYADTVYVKESKFDELEEDYASTKAIIIREITKLSTKTIHVTDTRGNKFSDSNFKHLPNLSLPKFSGNQLEWETFRDLFKAMVDQTNITDVQKFYYLKSSLTGKAAERIKNLPVNNANYNEAWSMLVRRFDNNRILLAAHMRKLLSCPVASSRSVDEILRLLDATNESIRAFTNIGRPVELWDDWFVHILVNKLDPSTREEWESSQKESEEFPLYEELSTFLEHTVRALEASNPIDTPSTTNNNIKSKSKSRSPVKGKPSQVSVNVSQSEPQSISKCCTLCQGQHFISYCSQFKKLKVAERSSKIQSLGLCYNCLRGNHKLNDCPSTKRCFVCSGKHHTFLHDVLQHNSSPSVQSSNPTSSTTTDQIGCHTSYLTNHLSNPSAQQPRGIFATAYIKLTSPNEKSIIVKGFLDSGSERSLITERVVQLLKLQKNKCDVSLKGIGNSSLGSSNYNVNLWLKSPKDSTFQLPLNALVMKSLVQIIPKDKPEHKEWSHLKDLDLADPNYSTNEIVDCVVGVDLLGHTLRPGLRQGPLNSPTGVLTTFGWIIFGNSSSQQTISQTCASTFQIEETDSLNLQLRRFWEIEELPKQTFLTNEEMKCEEIFENTHYRDQSGRYVVRLPLQKSADHLGQSREQVVSMFLRSEKQQSKNLITKSKYNSFMQEYIDLNHMRPVSDEDQSLPNQNYLPHHVITKSPDPSSAIRVVFNGSFLTISGLSLNDILYPGQKLQAAIWLIITKWRLWKFVFTADIVKMFRQIKIDSPDCNLLRIVWRPDPSQPLMDYCLTTVTYGTRSAPFLAIRVLNQLASDEKDHFPLGSDALLNNTYVDDIFSGGDSVEAAIQVRNELINILASAGITLSKWAANIDELIPDNNKETEESSKQFNFENSVTTLGLHWNPLSDEFHYKVTSFSQSKPTKRVVASEIAKLFDPLGWLAPFLLKAKLLLQDCWLAGSNWDEILPNHLQIEWNLFKDQFQQLNFIKIPRWVCTDSNTLGWELHGFSDASERAYSAALYLVNRTDNRPANSNLLMAKTKLAPVKVISLPKLELSAATLLAKLVSIVKENLMLSSKQIFYWSDSQIVLSWLQGHPSRWKPFVANRVSEIHSLSENSQWKHVPSKDNPADCATRGYSVKDLLNSSLWWNGPCWLLRDSQNWPINVQTANSDTELEVRSKFLVKNDEIDVNIIQNRENVDLLSRFSSVAKLLRVTSYCRRFISRCKNRNCIFEPYLTADELRDSLSIWIKIVQKQHFQEVIDLLSESKSLSKRNSSLVKLTPFLDNQNIMRVGGRIQNSFLTYDEKHPVILPKGNKLSELIVIQAHHDTLHGGQQLTLSKVLRKFWIISSKTLINKIIRSCVKCFRFRANFQTQLMGQLPNERINVSKPFSFTGLDYAGPFYILSSKGRGIKSYKGYVCLFVCLCSRAIHLELVSDYETKSFLAAFKRFTSRRGVCTKLWSDNARNFIGAARELRQLFIGATEIFTTVAEELAKQETTWSFIPPHSPHFGGIWEAGIKSVKHHLRRVVGETRMTFEELSTVLCQIEACLNSRPLYPNTADANSISAITPGHILTGGPIVSVPEPTLSDLNDHPVDRWKLITKMRDDFWNRWSCEYLSHLQQRSKWLFETNAVKIGDVVLIKEDNLPPTRWSLGKILQLHPGKDGLSRVATIKTQNSILKRSFSKLAVLPIKQM
ncbi:uncharacterized protein LOC122506254 [Leptopilina heterotoma]|uniref:uncharacterized protein LOC122498221 n=1 Tax=Leptopilina heterotoma TaxID=63436 RepID=UPI001CA85E6C|nr:uncharacterized protein LOC122498221 [Leptopilina heterotoma]XP_043474277.1 uncharacterized protein LOC122506254 [Leptopilina heterotoma]